MAEYVAGSRPGVSGVVMSGGAMDPKWIGISWPAGVKGHTTVNDPWREQEGIDGVRSAAERVGGRVEVYDYPGAGTSSRIQQDGRVPTRRGRAHVVPSS